MKNRCFLTIILCSILFACNKEVDMLKPENEKVISRQSYYTDFTPVTPCEASQIKVFINNCFTGTPYEQAIPEALSIYNDAPISLNYTIVEDTEDADLIFNCTEGQPCGYGFANTPVQGNGDITTTTFPSGGTIGREIKLGINWTNCPCAEEDLDICFFIHTALHEIMHTVGFTHNDNQSSSNVTLVEGTPTDSYDPESIINSGPIEFFYGDFCNPSCTFNENDLIALRHLYPPFEIEGPDHLNQGEHGFFCVYEDFEGEWQVSDNLAVGRVSDNCVKVYATNDCSGPGEISFCGVTTTINVNQDVICNAPSAPPVGWDNLCLYSSESYCYDFSSYSCLTGIEIESSSHKVHPTIEGTYVCLSLLTNKFEEVTLTVTPIGACGVPGPSQEWNITINSPEHCDGLANGPF